MIGRAIRAVWNSDRSYVFGVFAFIAAFIASVYLTVAKIFVDEVIDGPDEAFTGIDYFGPQFIVLLVLPLLVAAGPLLVLPRAKKQEIRRNHKVNSIISTLVLLAYVVLLFPFVGVYYLPEFIFSLASSISLFFGKDRRSRNAQGPSGAKGEIRLSGRSKKERRNERRSREVGPGGGRRRKRGG